MIRVDRRLLIGTDAELEQALFNSEDSSTLNTSFIERHNRRTPCHARRTEFLAGHLALIQAYYNFLRPHRALKFGKTLRAPAMQAGLVNRCLSFRDLFTSQAVFFLFFLIVALVRNGKLDYRSVAVMFWRSRYPTTVP